MPPPETRPSLIVRLKGERNELAWAEFVSAYEPFLRRLVGRRGVPERHVPDAVQQVLLAIARSVEGWQDDGDPASFRRWLAGVARNVTLKFLACQDALEQLAADRAEWSRVEGILKREAQSSSPDAAATGSAGLAAGWPAVSAADFAVDFLEPATDSETLGRLGDIDIHEVIGHGGMGIVLRGFQRELNRPVAVKVLAPHLATSGAARQRFAREARATAVIVHPNVMPILTVHSPGKLPHLVMPPAYRRRNTRLGGCVKSPKKMSLVRDKKSVPPTFWRT